MFNNIFFPFLKKYKDYIYDVYFTCLIPPFNQDAMGSQKQAELVTSKELTLHLFDMAMKIQNNLGIKVSATFNDINIIPNYENLEIFMRNLYPFYQRGLRSITLPHYHWIVSKKLQRAFPELFIKNTVLRRVSRPQEYVEYVEAGFNLVNIDRYNLRDRDNLKRLKKAYQKYKVPMAILVNEWCKGNCPAMDEHYEFNSKSKEKYFLSTISTLTCTSWGKEPSYYLKNAVMPYNRDDFEEILEYIQVLKLHGRSEYFLFEESMEIVKRYADENENILMPKLYKRMKFFDYDEKELKKWSNYIKNCKFECWSCTKCQELHKSARSKEFAL